MSRKIPSSIETKCQVVNERKCATSRDWRQCDEAYGVTAIPDQDVFRKKVRTNFQLFVTFGQQCTAVPEDEEQRDVFVSAKTFTLRGFIKSCSSNKESSKSSKREGIVKRKKCKVKKQSQCDKI